ncbi:MAG: hypothetical protein V5A46_05755 [Haloferacaceae archaeon]
MYTPGELVVELLTDLLDMVIVIGTEVALRDPLSLVAVAGGAAFIGIAVAVFGYSALGALLAEAGIALPRIGDGPRSRN